MRTSLQKRHQEVHDRISNNMNKGLNTHLLKPPGMKGEALFDHMTKHRELRTKGEGFAHEPGAHLMAEVTSKNKETLQHTATLLAGENITSKRLILNDAFGHGAKFKMAERKLNSLAHVKAHCAILNDSESLRKCENRLRLVRSIAEVNNNTELEKENKQQEKKNEITKKFPEAMAKLVEKKGDMSKPFKGDVLAILFVKCGVIEDSELLRDVLQAKLTAKIKDNQSRLGLDDQVDFSAFDK